jgi:hypothetical protein
MTAIPGTNYQVQGNIILDPDNRPISPEQFLQKVEAKEISLTRDSVRFMGSQFGPTLENSLFKASGLYVSTNVLSDRMANSEKVVGDIYALMAILAKATMDQKQQMTQMKQNQTDLQVTVMNKAADEALTAARWRMIKIKTEIGELKAQTSSVSDKLSGLGKVSEGVGGLAHAVGEYVAAEYDRKSKQLDADARKLEAMAGESRDLADSLREMNAKVRETLRDILAAENQATGTIVRT